MGKDKKRRRRRGDYNLDEGDTFEHHPKEELFLDDIIPTTTQDDGNKWTQIHRVFPHPSSQSQSYEETLLLVSVSIASWTVK